MSWGRPTGRQLLALFLLGALAPSSDLCMAAESTLEYGVKAAFLLNFTKFVDWPPAAFEDAQSPVGLCILGSDRFGRVLDEVLQGESVNGRRIVARRITQPPAEKACQVLFIDPGMKDLARTLSEIPRSVLTVGEGDRFIREGGMVAFVIDDHRVRFDINQSAAEKADLKLSAKLLTVARSVTR